jgi:Transglycosylase-like domain/LysM domain
MRPARYRGRHRHTSNAARLTAIGAVGAGTLVASVISPSLAHAATDAQWDRVAQCESGGNWHDDTGNGYYGGLQFSDHTWDSFDVDNYAGRADHATRKQQMDVADRVQKAQGWGAWPVCSQYRGEANRSHQHHGHKHHGHPRGRQVHRYETVTKGIVYYKVRSGDSLASIARHHHVKGGWHALYHRNRDVIGSNPGHLSVGMHLQLRKA